MPTIHDLREAFELLEENAPRTIPERTTPHQRRVLPLLAAGALIAAIAFALVVMRSARHPSAERPASSPTVHSTVPVQDRCPTCPFSPPLAHFVVGVTGSPLASARVHHGETISVTVQLTGDRKVTSVHDVRLMIGRVVGVGRGGPAGRFSYVLRIPVLERGDTFHGTWRVIGPYAHGDAALSVYYVIAGLPTNGSQFSAEAALGTLHIAGR